MSLYSASYEDFINEWKENGCNGMIDEMIKNAELKLFHGAISPNEKGVWEKTLPEFYKHLLTLEDQQKITPVHIFLEYLMPMLEYRRCDAIVIAKNEIGNCICILYEMKSEVNTDKTQENILQINGYYNTLNKMMINKIGEINKFLFYVNNESTNNSEVLEKIKAKGIFSNIDETSNFNFLEADKNIKKELEDKNFISKVIGDSNNIILNKNQNKIFSDIISAANDPSKTKTIFLINGDPGTGKTVLAMKFYKYFKIKKKEIKFLTSSKHMKHVIEELFDEDVFLEYQEDNTEDKIIIFDEVHGSKGSTIKNILESSKAKVVILFMDKKQITKLDSLKTIKENLFDNYEIEYFDLKSQFRCLESNYFIDQVDDLLYGSNNERNSYIHVTDNIEDLLHFVNKVSSKNIRIISNYTQEGGGYTFTDHKFTYHRIDGNIKDKQNLIDAYNYNLTNELFHGREKIVGMPLTVQGFEYDYSAIILDKDLYYDKKSQKWDISSKYIVERDLKMNISKNKNEIIEILKNRYRVLLTRARKGCYIYFEDKDTKEYFENTFMNSNNHKGEY